MFVRLVNQCWMSFTAIVTVSAPLLAADDVPETQDWVFSYAIMLLFLALTLLILLRPVKRSDSAFSSDEILAQKAEAMKKIQGGHR